MLLEKLTIENFQALKEPAEIEFGKVARSCTALIPRAKVPYSTRSSCWRGWGVKK